MDYLGDFAEDTTVRIYFTTNDGSGGAVAPSSAFEAADVAIYKDNNANQKATTNGITMTSPFDSVTGLHLLEIDTSNNTGDAGFWVTGSDYSVVLNPDETVDSQTVVAALGQFSIENRSLFTASVAELSGVTSAAETLANMVQLLHMALRNKVDVTGTTLEIHNDAGTIIGTKTLSDDGTTYSEAEMA